MKYFDLVDGKKTPCKSLIGNRDYFSLNWDELLRELGMSEVYKTGKKGLRLETKLYRHDKAKDLFVKIGVGKKALAISVTRKEDVSDLHSLVHSSWEIKDLHGVGDAYRVVSKLVSDIRGLYD